MHILPYLLFSAALLTQVLAKAQTLGSLEIYARPDLAYRTLQAKGEPAQTIRATRDHRETIALLPAIGLRYRRPLSPRHALSLGFSYSRMGNDLKEDGLRWGSQFNGMVFDPTLPSGEPDVSSRGHRYTYLTAPITYVYTLTQSQSSFTIHLSGGVEPGYLLRSGFRYKIDGKQEFARSNPDEFQRSSIGLVSSVQVRLRLKESVSLFAEPTFRHQLINLVATQPIGERLWTAGLALGLVWTAR